MALKITVWADKQKREVELAARLRKSLRTLAQVLEVVCGKYSDSLAGSAAEDLGDVLFIDSSIKKLDAFLAKVERKNRALFLVLQEDDPLPKSLEEGKVDDIVIEPFRTLEVLSKLLHYEQILKWNDVVEANHSIYELLNRFQEDLRLAERIQTAKVPKRFPNVRGLQVASRYFAGERSGGDFFDIAESKNKSHLSLILSHSTSYGLSSALITALMRVSLRLSSDRMGKAGAISEVIQKVSEELVLALGERERLSLFYATYSIEDRLFRSLNFGNALVYYAKAEEGFEHLPNQGEAISSKMKMAGYEESMIQLEPRGRLVLLSQGAVESLGGEGKIQALLNQGRQHKSSKSLNELVYQLKPNLTDPESMPAQDSTLMVIDIDSHVLQMSSNI